MPGELDDPSPSRSEAAFEVTMARSGVDSLSERVAVVDEAGLVRGDVVGRYVVLSQIGQGAMGAVYGAYDPDLDRKVALKLLLAHRGRGPEGKLRLMREAQAMARLAHPNVVTVHDVGSLGDRVWLAMEFIRGRTLTQWLAQRPRRWRDIVAIFVRAGEGLQAAHAAGLTHRDFKPDNVMIGPGDRVRVMDFGLALVTRKGAPHDPGEPRSSEALRLALTADGAIVGTPQYMAPEQWEGSPTEPRSDQFAFCVALWEAVHGRPPFAAETLAQLVAAVLAGNLHTPARGDVPGWLHRALLRGLSVDPQRRWPSMTALLEVLRTDQARRRQARWLIGCGALALTLTGAAIGQRIEGNQRQAHAELQDQARGARAHASALLGQVLRTRLGSLADYDPVVLEMRRLTAAHAALPAHAEAAAGPRGPEIAASLAERRAATARAAELVESFKTRHAIVRNSSQVFPILIAQLTADAPELDQPLIALLREMLRYNNSAGEEQAAAIRRALAAITEGPAAPPLVNRLELLRRHAALILEHRAEVDHIVEELLELQADRRYEGLAALISADDTATRGIDDGAVWAAVAASLGFAGAAAWLLLHRRTRRRSAATALPGSS